MINPTAPLRALGQRIVSGFPEPVANALRGAKRSVLNLRGTANVFTDIYANNAWDGTESVSGPGSSLVATENLRAALPKLLSELNVRTLLDVPCGDAYWISTCLPPEIHYTGGDIVADLITRNQRERAALGGFCVLNLVEDALPKCDFAMVRDCLIHLPNRLVQQALKNVKGSGCDYLFTTTYSGLSANIEIEIGGFRPVDLTMAPFGLPKPLRLIEESEGGGKAMGLWRIADIQP